jgi:hypothetical protein
VRWLERVLQFRFQMDGWRRVLGRGFGIWNLGRVSIRERWLLRFRGRRCEDHSGNEHIIQRGVCWPWGVDGLLLGMRCILQKLSKERTLHEKCAEHRAVVIVLIFFWESMPELYVIANKPSWYLQQKHLHIYGIRSRYPKAFDAFPLNAIQCWKKKLPH